MYDQQQDTFKLVKAEDWKTAALKSMDMGVVPRRQHDVRPRTGDVDAPVVTKKEFEEFMDR